MRTLAQGQGHLHSNRGIYLISLDSYTAKQRLEFTVVYSNCNNKMQIFVMVQKWYVRQNLTSEAFRA